MQAKVEESPFGIVLHFGYGADVPPPLYAKLMKLGFVKMRWSYIVSPPPHLYKELLQVAENIAHDYNQGKYRKYLIKPKSKHI